MTPLTLAFETISAADLPKVGGKGANLGELTRAGFNVPPGFCVTTRAFTCFMEGAKQDVYALLANLRADDLEGLRRVGGAVRACLDEVPLPAEVEGAVVNAWHTLGDGYAYAVRSSATAEDLPHASFAGQQDTYLNVRGKDALLASVKRCFISLFTDRAILYRIQNGFDHREVALSAVVQCMVQSDVAGILFTADPVTGNRNILSVDASFGLGEALVSGVVSADLYKVDKRTRGIIHRQVGEKGIAIRSLAEGGTEQVALAESERARPALTDLQVLELATLGSRIEAHYGGPQDVEWALAEDTFYITQARPITSLYPLPLPKPEDDALHVYFSFSHFQVMTDAMPPLALSLFRVAVPVGHADGGLESRRVHTAGGRLYFDLAPILRHPLGRRVFLRAFRNADQLAAGALAELAERPGLQARGERFRPLSLLPTARPYIFKTLHMLFRGGPEGVTDQTLRFMDSYLGAVKTRLDEEIDVRGKLGLAVSELRHAFTPIFTWVPYWVAGEVAAALLKVLMRNHDLTALGRGLTGNVTTEMNLAVGDLADAACASGVLRAHLSQTAVAAQTRLADATDLLGGKSFLQAWNVFINTYGARGPSEIDLSRPRWSEDPSSLLQMVVNTTGQSEPGAHRTHYQKLVVENRAAATAVGEVAYQGWFGWARAPLVRRFLRVSRNLTPLREHHKFFIVRLFALIKPVLLEAGKHLQAEGRLESEIDIWFLTLPEVFEVFDKPEKEVRALIKERRGTFKHDQTLSPPRVMTSDGEVPVVKLDGEGVPEGALVGSPVSAGVVEGTAKVVLDPGMEALEPGEILVASFTDPGWTPLFVNAAGLITEVGGLMTHGSVVAREFGIPAVVGVVDATKKIETGQLVRVHGDAGYVELLDNRPNAKVGA